MRDVAQTQQSVLCRRSSTSSSKPPMRQLNAGARVARVTTKLADLYWPQPAEQTAWVLLTPRWLCKPGHLQTYRENAAFTSCLQRQPGGEAAGR